MIRVGVTKSYPIPGKIYLTIHGPFGILAVPGMSEAEIVEVQEGIRIALAELHEPDPSSDDLPWHHDHARRGLGAEASTAGVRGTCTECSAPLVEGKCSLEPVSHEVGSC